MESPITTARAPVRIAGLRPFAVYAVVSVIQLAGLFAGAAQLASLTKPLLMPVLLLALIWSTLGRRTSIGLALNRATRGRRSSIVALAAAGIVFSWIGDVLLSTPGGLGFLLGLGSFFVAHLAYFVLFLGPLRTRPFRTRPFRTRRASSPLSPLGLLFVPWLVGLLVILGPHLGMLFVPVALYGLVLGLAAAAALGTNRLTAAGGVLFLLSDTVLALRLFLPGFSLWQADFLIMLLYVLGQGLIVLGAVRAAAGLSARQ